MASHYPANKNAPLASEWNQSPPPAQQPMGSSSIIERSIAEAADELGPLDDEGGLSNPCCTNYVSFG